MRLLLLTTVTMLSFVGCQGSSSNQQETGKAVALQQDFDRSGLDSAYFASGCFWCVEAIYEHVKGIPEAVSGFAGGQEPHPTYDEVARGQTQHAETVKVYYNPETISFRDLVKIYYGSQDPTTEGQDPDFGPQYRSIIFYQNQEEKQIAEEMKAKTAENYEAEVVTEIKELDGFYPASQYHQDYERKNPNKGYIQQVSKPRLEAFKQKFPEFIEKENPWKH